MNYFCIYLDHVQYKVFPFDLNRRYYAFFRAAKIADSLAKTYGSQRITIEDSLGAIVYRPEGDSK
jgi:hypothetical protein